MKEYKTRITLEIYNEKHTFESPYDDLSSNNIEAAFSRLMVCAGFSPSVLKEEDGDGHYEYVGTDEEVVKKKES